VCFVETASLHIEVVTVDLEQEKEGKDKEKGWVWFRQVRRVTLCVCVLFCSFTHCSKSL
jgi:hypothetical protein